MKQQCLHQVADNSPLSCSVASHARHLFKGMTKLQIGHPGLCTASVRQLGPDGSRVRYVENQTFSQLQCSVEGPRHHHQRQGVLGHHDISSMMIPRSDLTETARVGHIVGFARSCIYSTSCMALKPFLPTYSSIEARQPAYAWPTF
jgi:hypothetical protein